MSRSLGVIGRGAQAPPIDVAGRVIAQAVAEAGAVTGVVADMDAAELRKHDTLADRVVVLTPQPAA
jgi:hypothetical protein